MRPTNTCRRIESLVTQFFLSWLHNNFYFPTFASEGAWVFNILVAVYEPINNISFFFLGLSFDVFFVCKSSSRKIFLLGSWAAAAAAKVDECFIVLLNGCLIIFLGGPEWVVN